MISNGSRPSIQIPEIRFDGDGGRQGDRVAFDLGRSRSPRAGMEIIVGGEVATIDRAEKLPNMPLGWWLVGLAA